MSYYGKHMFFCINQKPDGKRCCQDANASDVCTYAKHKIKDMGLKGPGGVRVSSSGCMGRCELGPILVIYPDGIWYTYDTFSDIDEIIDETIVNGRIVNRLLIDPLHET